jgi:hypothetical protein
MLLVLVLGTLQGAAAGDVASQDRLSRLKSALLARLCWGDYWGVSLFTPGGDLPLKIRLRNAQHWNQ